MSFTPVTYGFHCTDLNKTHQPQRHCLVISSAEFLSKSVNKYENYGYIFSTTVTQPVFMGGTLVKERVVEKPIPNITQIRQRFSR
jgi:hypothetical protein